MDHLPLDDHPLFRELAPFWGDWLDHPTADAYWQPVSPAARYERVGSPALHISGWYDLFLSATFENFVGMRQRGGTEAARRNQRVIIGPWSHSNYSGSFPEREFGPAASSDAIDLAGTQLRWFDHLLKGVDNGVEAEPPVMLFVMGIDEWRTEANWPLPDTQERPPICTALGRPTRCTATARCRRSRRLTSHRTCTSPTHCARPRPSGAGALPWRERERAA